MRKLAVGLLLGALLALPLMACGGSADTPAAPVAATTAQPASVTTSDGWSEVASLDVEWPVGAKQTDFKSPFFTPESGLMEITWAVEKMDEADEALGWNASILVYEKGHSLDNDDAFASEAFWRLFFIDAESTDTEGTMEFELEPGREYYLFAELWQSKAQAVVSEKD